jgi:ABC-type branched-subunit amino acid transport system ATPase component
MIVFLMIVLAAITWLITNLQKSSTGRAITAVRNSESAAATSGISIPRTKLAIFALSAAVAGFGGVLVATNNGNISDGTFVTQAGLAWLAAVVLFGIRRPQGAIIAGLVTACSTPIFTNGWHFAFFPTFLHWNGLGSSTATYVANALFGMGAVQLAREPDGVLAITAAQNRARRDKRRAKREAREDRPTIDRSTIDLTKTTVDPSDETEPMTPTTLAAAASSGATHHINSSHDASSTTAAARADDAVLRLDDVRSGYGLVEVLHGVSLDVRAGEITTILGPNGAGKSTLCQTIAGLVAVRSGTVVHRGHDVGSLRAHQRSKRGIVLAPESRGVFAGLTVRENLQMWLPDADERDSAYDRFPILGERRNLPAGSLSGGEQQMLTLAPLLVRPPDVLVADEPSLGLAPLIVEQILQIFVELRDRGVALVLVEEKARGVLDIADSVSFISLGHMLWSGPRVDVDEELLAQAYLGHVRV